MSGQKSLFVHAARREGKTAVLGLRRRAQEVYQKLLQDGLLRQGDPVQALVEFALAERGRVDQLENTHALVLYFGSKQGREEFIALVREVKPGMVTRKVP